MSRVRADLSRMIIDARRVNDEKSRKMEDTLQVVNEKAIDFLEMGETPQDLLSKHIHLDVVHGEVNAVEEAIYYSLSRQHGNVLEADDSIKRRELPLIIARLLTEHDLNREEKRYLFTRLANRYLGHGILQPLWQDKRITEIMTNSPDEIWVEIGGELKRVGAEGEIYTDLSFENISDYESYVHTLFDQTGRSIDRTKCAQTGELLDGSRITVNWYPVVRYPTINVRKPATTTHRYTSESYIATGAANESMMRFLEIAAKGYSNIIVSGATGTGKTVVLRIAIEEHTTEDRVIYIEDTRELNPIHPHFISLQTVEDRKEDPLDYAALIRQTLRMRPDRIGIQEIRGGSEAAAILKAIMAGHDGVITTAHSSSPQQIIFLLIIWLKESGINVEEVYLKKMVHEALDILVFTQRLKNGKRRITEIWEVLSWRNENVQDFEKLFEYDYESDSHKQVGFVSKKFLDKCRKYQTVVPKEFYDTEIVS